MLNRFKTVENSVEKVENGLNKGFSLTQFVENVGRKKSVKYKNKSRPIAKPQPIKNG